MSQGEKVQVPWSDIDTLLLDLDGTLLDLAFDNFFWLELVPREYARAKSLDLAEARDAVTSRTEALVGTLPWYCIDHWSSELDLDIAALKRRHRDKIRFLPGACDFLALARQLDKHLVIVTNAHHVTLAIKCEQTRVDSLVDTVVSSHDFGIEKERPGFWHAFEASHGIDRERALLVEDNLTVLQAAKGFGIAHSIAIRRPDSTRESRTVEGFAAVEGVASLVD